MKHQSVLVTGGLGQIGSYVCEALEKQGCEVTVLDIRQPAGAVARFVHGDIRDRELVRRAVKDVDAVVHCAAQIFVTRSVEEPLFDADTNIMGTLNLLEAARDAKVGRFVFFSSAAVYGETVRLPVDEGHPQCPMSPYGVSKLAGEKYALAFHKVYGLPATVIRPFNVYSPRQDPSNPYSGVIAKFIDRASQGLPPVIMGDGTATRDFVSAHDVVDMVMLMLEKDAAVGKAFNCGTGKPTRIDALAQAVIARYGGRLKPEFRPDRPGDIRDSYSDIAAAREALGYRPRVGLEAGLREIVESKSK